MELLRPSSLAEFAALGDRPSARALAGGTELVPLLRDGLVEAETLVHVHDVVPKGIRDGGARIGAAT